MNLEFGWLETLLIAAVTLTKFRTRKVKRDHWTRYLVIWMLLKVPFWPMMQCVKIQPTDSWHAPVSYLICSFQVLFLYTFQNFSNVFCCILQVCDTYLLARVRSLFEAIQIIKGPLSRSLWDKRGKQEKYTKWVSSKHRIWVKFIFWCDKAILIQQQHMQNLLKVQTYESKK